MVLKEFQDTLLLPCAGRIEQKWLNMQGIWPIWLPMVGHALATTHVYNLKYTSLRLLMVFLCVSMVLCLIHDSPEPWLNQLYARRSCLAAPTLLGNDATVNTGKWLSFSPSLWPVLVFYCHGRSKFSAATMSRIQIIMLYLFIAWCDGKAVYCCAVLCCTVVRSAVLVLGEHLIYNGHGPAWASLGHWACIRLGYAIGPRQYVWSRRWFNTVGTWWKPCFLLLNLVACN